MISLDQARGIMGGTAVSAEGERLGKVGQVYLDDQTGQPEWAAVSTGLFSGRESFVPLALAEINGAELQVPYDKDTVKGAPSIDAEGGHLSQQDEAELYTYYGLDYAEADSGSDDGRYPPAPGVGEAMIRSEERLTVGTERQEVGRARLRKYIVTEQQTVTVPVSRQQLRIEREPITAAHADFLATDPTGGPMLSEEEHEIVLYADRAVVDKETVPVERIRLDTDVVNTQETITAEIRKEQIEAGTVETAGGRLDPQRLPQG